MYVPAAPKVIGEIIRERTDDRGNPVVDVNVYARPGETVTVTPREAGWIVSHRMWNNATLYVVFLKYYLFVVAAGKEEAERAVRTEHPGWRVTAIADVVEENPNAAAGQPTYVVRQYSDPSKLTSLIRRLPTTPASAGTPTVSAPPVLDTPTRHV
jgi:hypothetical protein